MKPSDNKRRHGEEHSHTCCEPEAWQDVAIHLYRFDTLDSTNESAKELIRSDPTQPSFAVLAAKQTSGKGQHGNSWSSPQGGLYLTLAVHDKGQELSQSGVIDQIRLDIAIKVRTVLKQQCKAGTAICIKWPNDFYTTDGKLGGILCETISSHPHWLIVGIGVNVYRKEQVKFAAPEYSISYLKDYLVSSAYQIDFITQQVLQSLQAYC